MTPIYFPFTFVTETAATRLRAWFDRVGLLVPSVSLKTDCLAAGVDPDAWQIHCPPSQDEAALAILETDLRQWAEVHAGTDLAAVLAARDEQSPFSTLPPVSRLRSRIQAGAKGKQSPAAALDPLLTARVFLRLAHGLDRDRDSIRAQLGALAGIEKEMLDTLRGQPDEAPASLSTVEAGEDAGAFLTERRLAAWGRLALGIGVPSKVLVTDSPAVISALDDFVSPLRPVWELTAAHAQAADPSAPGRVAEAITRTLAGEAASAATRADRLSASGRGVTMFAVDLSPEAFCHRLIVGRAARGALSPPSGRCLVLWIGRSAEPSQAGEVV